MATGSDVGAAVGALVACVSACMAGGGAWFVPIGDLDGGDFSSQALAVSADGLVVAGSSHSANGTTGENGCCEAIRWTASDGLLALGDLGGTVFESKALALSANGGVIVGRGHVGVNLAFRWIGGPLLELPELPGGGVGGASATGISSDGTVIVGHDNAASGEEAFLYRVGESIEGLGDLPGGIFRSRAESISADGSTVVGWSISEQGWEAFRWTADGEMEGLGDLEGGSFRSEARAVSADGSVIVGLAVGEDGLTSFRHADEVMADLGDLPGGGMTSEALDTSADGVVVVGYGTTDLGAEAFVWLEPCGMRSVRVELEELGVELEGWILRRATGVSADGRTIVGWGVNPGGNVEGWIARLPRPDCTPGSCVGDTDDSDLVDADDLINVILDWGTAGDEHGGDVNADGTVDVDDLLELLLAWGPCI